MRHLSSFLGTLLLVLPLTGAADEPSLAWVAQSRVLANQLGTELKSELGKALAAGGPVAAISVCRTKAPAIAARLSVRPGHWFRARPAARRGQRALALHFRVCPCPLVPVH
jgi:hypothetical protein